MITYFFPPVVYGSSLRVFNFARKLKDYNWSSTVLTLNHRLFTGLKDYSLVDSVKSADIVVYPVTPGRLKWGFARMGFPTGGREMFSRFFSKVSRFIYPVESEAVWIRKAIKAGEKIIKKRKPNVIVSFAPPISSVQVGAVLSSKFKIPLVIDYSFVPELTKRGRAVERKLLNRGFIITVDSRKVKDYLLVGNPHLRYDAVKIIPSGFDSAEFKVSAELDKNFTLAVCSGRLNVSRLGPLFYAVSRFVNRFKIKKFKLKAVGVPTHDLIALINQLGLKRFVDISVNINRQSYIKLLLNSSFLIYLDELDIVNVPYDYIGSGRPVIALIKNGDSYRYVIGKYDGILMASATDASSIERAIEDAYVMFGENPTARVERKEPEQYELDNIIVNFVRELEFLTTD